MSAIAGFTRFWQYLDYKVTTLFTETEVAKLFPERLPVHAPAELADR